MKGNGSLINAGMMLQECGLALADTLLAFMVETNDIALYDTPAPLFPIELKLTLCAHQSDRCARFVRSPA